MSDQQLPKPPDFDSTEPDYDAVGRIANTWFALTVNDFFALPHEEQLRIAERAGVTRARYPGFCKALITMAHTPKHCPRAN